MDVWVEHELQGCHFPDQRLRSRIGKVLRNLSGKIGDSIPTACQGWAATKAAYRFLDNERVSEASHVGSEGGGDRRPEIPSG